MQFFRTQYKKIIAKLSPQAILVLSFIVVILIGTYLLAQPFSVTGSGLNFIDSLFTATSAACVTGLIVVDTATCFSFAGKIIILLLIQLGGLGIMTFSVFFLFFLRGRFGIGGREIIQETLAFFNTINLRALLNSVFLFTFTFEAAGALLLFPRFLMDMPLKDAFFNAVFHSISAFCNAGFSNFPDSLMRYQSDFYINIIIMLLIISGGLGFIVIYELNRKRIDGIKFNRLSLHSRIVLIYTLSLILIGMAGIFVFEYYVSMKESGLFTKIIASLFQSVTARTAGFNTIDIGAISMPSIFILINLMFIGASPASCGGGIKTATLAIVLAFIRSKLKDQKNVNLFYNSLPLKVVTKAIVVMVFALIVVLLFSFLISVTELNIKSFADNSEQFIRIVFEVVSAFGTVGLSTGITPEMSSLSRIFITALMLIGRVGPLTITIIFTQKKEIDIQYAEDNILVG